MRAAAALAALLCSTATAAAAKADKQVLNTWWWPPGTEKQAESVGILSRGVVWMTGMMEANRTYPLTITQEVSDVTDIANAAKVPLSGVVDCVVSCAPGAAETTRRLFRAALPKHVVLTVVEQKGEISFMNSSISCTATEDAASTTPRTFIVGNAVGALSGGLLWLTATADQPDAAVAGVAAVTKAAGGRGVQDLADCTMYLSSISAAGAARAAFAAAFKGSSAPAPTLLIVEAGIDAGEVALRCAASPGTALPERTHAPGRELRPGEVHIRRAGGFLWAVAGAAQANSTDAFAALQGALSAAGSSATDAVNCHFWIRNQTRMQELFAGFYQFFNVAHFPPPSRTEFSSANDCGGCEVVMRCVTVLP